MVIPGIISFLEHIKRYKNRKIGILTHQAACTLNFEFTLVAILNKGLDVKVVFAPEHGFFSEEQDQKPVNNAQLYGIPVISLYKHTPMPDKEQLSLIDTLIIDLVDVGARYYTYVWSSVLLLKELSGRDIEVIILDRPNPLGGEFMEGFILRKEFFSFVGLLPVPVVHGMTIGELLLMARDFYNIDLKITVYPVKGWKRDMKYQDTGLWFIPPSPNMPYITTSMVYPGMCLLEATNISEGRGTTRPFEMFGAPFIDPFKLVKALGDVEGAVVRPYYFIPTFNKYAGMRVGGGFVHVMDPDRYRPFEFGIKLLATLNRLYPDEFRFKDPPYEFEYEKMPIDILTGSDFIRKNIDNLNMKELGALWQKDIEKFKKMREQYLLYA